MPVSHHKRVPALSSPPKAFTNARYLSLIHIFKENLKGEKGDKGDKGDTGEKGGDGTNGADGINGKDGTSIAVSYTHLDVYKRQALDSCSDA